MKAQVLTLPAGLAGKGALFDAYHAVLRTPWPLGNWDALADFLCDPAWLPAGDVTIRYEDRPLAAALKEQTIHAEVVAEANRFWEERPKGYFWPQDDSTARTVRLLLPDA